MTTFLPDANLLVALVQPRSPHHQAARHWFRREGHHSWCSCAVTLNGAVRVLRSQSTSINSITFEQSIELVESLLPLGSHSSISSSISLLDADLLDRGVNVTAKQSTDVYLLALAVHHDAVLATFDRSIPAQAVRNGEEHLLVLG